MYLKTSHGITTISYRDGNCQIREKVTSPGEGFKKLMEIRKKKLFEEFMKELREENENTF